MSSKPKSKSYVVLQGGNWKQPRTIARYRVGARNEKEAVELLKKEVGKHIKARVYYEEKDRFLPHGTVICETKRKLN